MARSAGSRLPVHSSWVSASRNSFSRPARTLCQISKADDVYTYRLLINQYKTKNSSPNEMSLNVLYTAVEKVFLEFDPNIKVKSEYVDRKVKHSLF